MLDLLFVLNKILELIAFTWCFAGFAGSINSFSGWMLQSFTAFSNFEGYDRGGFQDVSTLRQCDVLRARD